MTTLYLRSTNPQIPITRLEQSSVWPNAGIGTSTGQANKYLSSVIGTNGAGTTISWASVASASHQDGLVAKFVSDSLAAQTFGSGTWTFGCAATEATSAANAQLGFSLYVWRPSTSAVVGYIYNTHAGSGNEWATALGTAGRVTTFSGSNVTAQVRDVLVLEVWCHQATQGDAVSRALTFLFGGGTTPTEGSAATTGNVASYLSTATTILFATADPLKVGLENYGCTGTLSITWGDADTTFLQSMNCPAWDIPDLTPLLIEYSVRGQDRRIPGVTGTLPYRRRYDVTEHSLLMWITGDVDRFGVAYTNPRQGLEQNLRFLRDTVINPDVPASMPSTGVRAATLTTIDGRTLTANIHVLGMRISDVLGADDHAWVNAALQISIPSGTFVYQ